ncbi:hypothetical protein JMG10_49465, partial [Nostoc ellipsosporum NOK]|nr:hypothetical protein [Nostoc ellipsosporum NOK]
MRKTVMMLATAFTALAGTPALAQITPAIPEGTPPAATPNAPVTFDVAAAKARIQASLDKQYPHLDALYKDCLLYTSD